jgi:hypothetical protein
LLVILQELARAAPYSAHLEYLGFRLQSHWGANIKVIRDSWHLMPIDQPYRLAVAIRTFVFPLTKVGKSWLCIALVFPTRRQSYSVCIVGNWETGQKRGCGK